MNKSNQSDRQTGISVVILAAGQGKRMHSALPKMLQPIAGKPMLAHVIGAARSLKPDAICVVHGHGGEQVREYFSGDADLIWAKQEPQLGTGHAVQQAIPHLPDKGITLVLYGDVPLIRSDTLEPLIVSAKAGELAWLTMTVAEPKGLGRVRRNAAGQVIDIVEDKDATDAEKAITEINTGILACPTDWLTKWLPRLKNENQQAEYYLTDILAMAIEDGFSVHTLSPGSEAEITGVNNKEQLAALERAHQSGIARSLMEQGTTLADPTRLDVRGQLVCGNDQNNDVSIDVNCIFQGDVTLGPNVKIGANCILRNCTIGAGTEVLPFTLIEEATIGTNARIGPYARIRPGTALADDVHIGNFVEVKASEFGRGSKANHLTYIGDTSVGKNVNIGAGTITCNYDGANKHRTVIEDNVHIGSDVQLVAPVTIGAGADIGAGTTVWKDVAPGGLTLNEKTQVRKADWTRPAKKK